MKSILSRILLAAASCIAMTAASAATGTAAGTIVHVYTCGDGRVLVTGLSFSNNYCSNNGGFWVDGAHPHLQRILALVLSAQASGATVTVTAKTDNCWYPEITQDPSTYVIVTKT